MKMTFKTTMVVAGLVACAAAQATSFISQNTDNNTIVGGNSVSCNASGVHTDNTYARAFTLADHGVTTAYQVSSVRFGVETASAASGAQSVTVRIYDGFTTSGNTMVPGTLLNTASVMVENGTNFFMTVPISGLVSSGKLVAEVFTPAAGTNSFFLASNNMGNMTSAYIMAPACGVNAHTKLSAIGFPNDHKLIAVNGQPVPEPSTMAVLAAGALMARRRRKSA